MNVYVDSSVVLRVVLGEQGQLASWPEIDRPVSSELIRLECLRTIDRARIVHGLDDEIVSERRAAALEIIDAFELVPLTSQVLERAADPFPTLVGSLDAIHLASAVMARQAIDGLILATHDHQLAVAAVAVGFAVAP